METTKEILDWNLEHPGEDFIAFDILNPQKKSKKKYITVYLK